ncbi:MAG: hypothetical protein QNJ97_18190, partial [Myxococcota bacterium]|nr:hypothetical protein [Myxococcota bacterium]
VLYSCHTLHFPWRRIYIHSLHTFATLIHSHEPVCNVRVNSIEDALASGKAISQDLLDEKKVSYDIATLIEFRYIRVERYLPKLVKKVSDRYGWEMNEKEWNWGSDDFFSILTSQDYQSKYNHLPEYHNIVADECLHFVGKEIKANAALEPSSINWESLRSRIQQAKRHIETAIYMTPEDAVFAVTRFEIDVLESMVEAIYEANHSGDGAHDSIAWQFENQEASVNRFIRMPILPRVRGYWICSETDNDESPLCFIAKKYGFINEYNTLIDDIFNRPDVVIHKPIVANASKYKNQLAPCLSLKSK